MGSADIIQFLFVQAMRSVLCSLQRIYLTQIICWKREVLPWNGYAANFVRNKRVRRRSSLPCNKRPVIPTASILNVRSLHQMIN
jgi:hypothetical protein